MHRDPKHTESSLKGNESQRRDRIIHKIRLSELGGLSQDDIASMVASGDVELLVRRSDVADGTDGGWSKRIAGLFEKVAQGLDGAPEHENRTIIVNIVAAR